MTIDKKSNLIHIVKYETKTYFLNKNISKKKWNRKRISIFL